MVDSIRSVQRALGILRLLAEVRKPLGVAEVSQSTGLPPATAHRLLVTLVDEGWVEQDPQSTQYELGTGILGTAAVALAYSRFVQAAKLTLNDISEVSGLNSYLGVLVGHRVAYLAAAPGRDGHDVKFRVGVVEQAHAVADGKVLLAGMEPDRVRQLYGPSPVMRQFTPNTITNMEDLERELEVVRTQGYAVDRGERTPNWCFVAVPVRGRSFNPIAAIVAGGHESMLPPEKLEWLPREMHMAAEQLSVRMGYLEE